MDSLPIQLALLGGGRAAQAAHLPALAGRGDLARVCFLIEPDPVVAEVVRARWGITAIFPTLAEAPIDQCSAAVVATPWHSHCDDVITLCEAGVNVLCEKPFTMFSSEHQRMVDAASRAGVVLQVAYQRRFDPAVQELHRAMAQFDLSKTPLSIDVHVDDPNSSALTEHYRIVRSEKPSGEDRAAARRAAERAVSDNFVLDEAAVWAFRALHASLVHDINIVLGATGLHLVNASEVDDLDARAHWNEESSQVELHLTLADRVKMSFAYRRAIDRPFQSKHRYRFGSQSLELSLGNPYLPYGGSTITSNKKGMHSRSIDLPLVAAFEQQLVDFIGRCIRNEGDQSPTMVGTELLLLSRAFQNGLAKPRSTSSSHRRHRPHTHHLD